MKETDNIRIMHQLGVSLAEEGVSEQTRNLFEEANTRVKLETQQKLDLIEINGSLQDQISELAKYIEKLQEREAEMREAMKRMEDRLDKKESGVYTSSTITADDIVKSFVERLGTLQERVDAKRVFADIFGENGAWIEARNKLNEHGYFREERPHLPISYKGCNLIELKFFDRTTYVTMEEQKRLKVLLNHAVGTIDTQEDSSWFCIYAAYRYVKGKLGTKGGYTDFFSDIEAFLPDVLTKINPDEKGDKRYSRYTQMLGRVANNWFVDDGKLPPLNNLLFNKVKCTKEQFDSYSLIIKNLWRDFKKLEDIINQEK